MLDFLYRKFRPSESATRTEGCHGGDAEPFQRQGNPQISGGEGQRRRLEPGNPAAILGSRWIDLVHPEDREGTVKSWSDALATKSNYQCEHRVLQPDGSYRWMLSRAAPILLENGAVREWVGISSDIQDRKVWPAADASRETVMTGSQLRAARGVLNWSVRELSQAAGVSSSTIRRLEEMDGPPPGREEALAPLQAALEGAGVEFLFPPTGKPGVRPR